MESMELDMELPMILFTNNWAVMDLASGWSTLTRTCHIVTKLMFLQGLKESKLIFVEHISTDNMIADIFTKNLAAGPFLRIIRHFVGNGEILDEREETEDE